VLELSDEVLLVARNHVDGVVAIDQIAVLVSLERCLTLNLLLDMLRQIADVLNRSHLVTASFLRATCVLVHYLLRISALTLLVLFKMSGVAG